MLPALRKAALWTYISDRRFVIILVLQSLLLFFKFAYMQWQYGLYFTNARRWHTTNFLRWCIVMRVWQLQGGSCNIWNLNRLWKKKIWIFFQNYGFITKIEPFHLRMKRNIIQMTFTDRLTVPHLINPIFQYIFDCLGFRPMNDNFNFVFQGLNRLRMASVTLTLNGSPTKNSPTGSNRLSKATNWHQNFGSLFDFRKRSAKDRLLRWLCGKWSCPVETKCCPSHPL